MLLAVEELSLELFDRQEGHRWYRIKSWLDGDMVLTVERLRTVCP